MYAVYPVMDILCLSLKIYIIIMTHFIYALWTKLLDLFEFQILLAVVLAGPDQMIYMVPGPDIPHIGLNSE